MKFLLVRVLEFNRIVLNILIFCIVLFSIFSQNIAKADSLSLETLQLPDDWWKNLANSRAWLLALFYKKELFEHKSLVVDPKFFLSPDGFENPEQELRTFLKKLLIESPIEPEKSSLYCRFPQRVALVKKALAQQGIKLNKKHCAEWEEFIKNVNPDAVSLVFSSYYPNNPSSLFGHNFLRVSRKRTMTGTPSALLDLSISYSAHPTTDNPILYTLYGLFGKFPGKFDLLPYYIKVQEYNNSESRDLWEFDLNFSNDETMSMLKTLWEIKDSYIPYYYFDENCAYVLLFLLEAARPSLYLHEEYFLSVVPSDTIIRLNKGNTLVKQTHFLPSAYRRFLKLYNILDYIEKDILQKIIYNKMTIDEYEKLDIPNNYKKERVLDVLIEYIDFDESLAGSKESVKWRDLRKQTLFYRAKLGKENSTNFNIDDAQQFQERENPLNAHLSSRISLYQGLRNNIPLLYFYWRPALHDLASKSDGYSKQLEIGLLNTEIGITYPELKMANFYFEKISLLHIFSANSSPNIVPRFAWLLDAEWSKDNSAKISRTLFRIGIGKGLETENNNFFALLISEIHYNKYLALGGGFVGGTVFSLSSDFRLRLDFRTMYFLKTPPNLESKGSFIFSYSPNSIFEIRLEGLIYLPNFWETKIGFLYYF